VLTLVTVIWSAVHYFAPAKASSTILLPPYANTPPPHLIKALPDFSAITNVNEKKSLFFTYLLPLIEDENNHLIQLRRALLNFYVQHSNSMTSQPTPDEQHWLKGLASYYGTDSDNDPKKIIEDLLLRIDLIPASLVLAQAAIESGWGTSRFAQEGNNLFGQWCFKRGCGIVPKNRSSNKSHEVARFKDINSSIRSYMKNINSFSAYSEFRALRDKISSDQKRSSDDTLLLLAGLERYSEQGLIYIQKLESVIKSNNLTQFDVDA
jgi:Bax protein